MAVLLTALGVTDQALKELERAGDECSSALHTMTVDPHVDALRGNPRFDKLRARMQDRALAH
jgi:hypothetical protein